MNRLIINADDFGMTKEKSDVIIAAIEQGLIQDSTLLVNFEDSAYAAELAHQHNIASLIGIHLNLTAGIALTREIKAENRFCNADGEFHFKKGRRLVFLEASERRAIYKELAEQIKLCRKWGIPITHADSHSHIHEEPAILPIIRSLLKSEKIPYLRLTMNFVRTAVHTVIYRRIYNSILSISNLAGTTHFGCINDYKQNQSRFNSRHIVELMVHPTEIINGQIYDGFINRNLSVEIPALLKGNQLISYRSLNNLSGLSEVDPLEIQVTH